MKSHRYLARVGSSALILLAAILACTPATAQAPAVQAATKSGRVSVMRLRLPWAESVSKAVWVYRPPAPDSRNLPVLYFLHGLPGAPYDVFRAGLAHSLDSFFAAGHRPFVVVAANGNGIVHGDTEWADSDDGRDRVETFLTQVVIPAVEGRHRRSPNRRAIAGFSMGGYGAMNLALRHRDLFDQVVSIAGYFHADDPSGMFAGNPALIAANSPDKLVDQARGLRILLIDGRQDRLPVVAGESQRFAALLHADGIPVVLKLPDGRHNWNLVSSQFGAIERFLERGWN